MKFVACIYMILITASSMCFGITTVQVYNAMEGNLCIKSAFITSYLGERSIYGCAFLCLCNQRCQAFSLADGPCQLFVFDKCSKSVRDCSCSRRGQVFMKQQPGLEAGALCPPGYGDDLCGVKYKIYSNTGTWWTSRQKCESENGLVIMADVSNATEMDHVDVIYNARSFGKSFYLGGFQAPGSQEPAGGWYWVGCNITMDGSLWSPDNYLDLQNVVGRWSGLAEPTDFFEADHDVTSVLCECVSPFD